jgi:hypothetical protein
VTLVITFTLVAKIILLPFFGHTLDRLSNVVPGAMCAAGVINANAYGFPLLGWKLGVLALAGLWLLVNRTDLAASDHPLMRRKLGLFFVIGMVVVVEWVLEVLYLTNISILTPVQCCSIIYGVATAGNGLPLGLDNSLLLLLFYLLFALNLTLTWLRYHFLNFLASIAFVYIGYLAVVYFFGTYVYQLPTHQCPFCMLQPEYHWAGFLIWGSLLFGAFFGAVVWPLRVLTGQEMPQCRRWCILLLTVFMLVVSLYPVVYRWKNGVWLT